jgi:hypothetical protein
LWLAYTSGSPNAKFAVGLRAATPFKTSLLRLQIDFIAEELQKAQSENAEEALFMFDTIGYLRVLGQIGAEARAALPEVERVSKPQDRRTRMAAEETLAAIK